MQTYHQPSFLFYARMPAMGTLFLVATPIGNLSDLSPRGVEALQSVNKIYAEDTRRTGLLLRHFHIQTKLASYYQYNELEKIPEILQELASTDLALVSDAGTPLISDPGFKLVREVLKAGFGVISIPGPNAAILALTNSGLPTDRFSFLGFLPKKEVALRKLLNEVKDWRTTLIFYESPFRLTKDLPILLEVLGDRPTAICRELTKLHEETKRGSLSSLISELKGSPKGEVTIVVGINPDDK